MTTQSKPRRMTVAEFLDWASTQPRGRYELVRGNVVAMAAERLRHIRVKGAVFLALTRAVERAGLPFTVFTGRRDDLDHNEGGLQGHRVRITRRTALHRGIGLSRVIFIDHHHRAVVRA